MSAYDTHPQEGTDEIIEAGDEGEVLEEPGYTYHIEPARVGGARYVRCEGCGRESVPADPDRILHRDGCPNADA